MEPQTEPGQPMAEREKVIHHVSAGKGRESWEQAVFFSLAAGLPALPARERDQTRAKHKYEYILTEKPG